MISAATGKNAGHCIEMRGDYIQMGMLRESQGYGNEQQTKITALIQLTFQEREMDNNIQITHIKCSGGKQSR